MRTMNAHFAGLCKSAASLVRQLGASRPVDSRSLLPRCSTLPARREQRSSAPK